MDHLRWWQLCRASVKGRASSQLMHYGESSEVYTLNRRGSYSCWDVVKSSTPLTTWR